VKSVPLILHDHRADIWTRWAEELRDVVDDDYRELIASQVGERVVRSITEDLVACSEAEPYQLPALLRAAGERVAAEAASRRSLGFEALDVMRALQALRGVLLDVLVDALASDEMPSFADTLYQFKGVDAYLDALVRALFKLC